MEHKMILRSNPNNNTFSMCNPNGSGSGHDFSCAGIVFEEKIGRGLELAASRLNSHVAFGSENVPLSEVYKVFTQIGIPEGVAVTLTNALKHGLEYTYTVTYTEPDLQAEGNKIPDLSPVTVSLSNFHLVTPERLD